MKCQILAYIILSLFPLIGWAEGKGCKVVYSRADVTQLDCNGDGRIDVVDVHAKGHHPVHIFVGRDLAAAHQLGEFFHSLPGHKDCRGDDHYTTVSNPRIQPLLRPLRGRFHPVNVLSALR